MRRGRRRRRREPEGAVVAAVAPREEGGPSYPRGEGVGPPEGKQGHGEGRRFVQSRDRSRAVERRAPRAGDRGAEPAVVAPDEDSAAAQSAS